MKYLFFIFLICTGVTKAQQNYKLKVLFTADSVSLANKIKVKSVISDSISVYQEAERLLSQLQFKGYLLAEVKTLKFKEKTAELLIEPNEQYLLVKLGAGNLSQDARNAAGFRLRDFKNVTFDQQKLNRLFENLLIHYDENGYPFANLAMDSITISDGSISANINVQLNERFVYDSLEIVGSAKISPIFLQTYLGAKTNSVYSERAVINTNNRLIELPYLEVVKEPTVTFLQNNAKLTVFINKKNANQFDGILGLQQSPIDNKIQLIGNLRLRLQNSFKRGELINLNYQGLAEKSQLLELEANLPNVLSTDFGLNPSLRIYKQDTAFLNVETKLGFGYLFNGNNTLQVYIENQATNLIAVDQYKNAATLPSMLDANTTFYGLGLNIEKLDYRFNPRKGFSVNLNTAVGAKKIKMNSAIDKDLYRYVPLNSTSYKFFSKVNYYVTLDKQLVLALNNESAILSGKYVVDNELFRLGGQNSLRGFNERSILASAYSYGNAELRYLLSQNSFLFAFYNQAYVQQKTAQLNTNDFPFGFGTGINFETNVGVLSISYALGKQRNNPLNLRQGKIHFGIIALF